MTKETIIQNLSTNHQGFIDLVSSLSEAEFMLSPNNKWTAGQQFEHIYLSVSPLTMALRLPLFVLKWRFGKANRPSKDYDALVKKYHDKLAQGGAASGRFIPRPVTFKQKEKIKQSLQKTVEGLCKATNGFSETKLDEYILPHPLLGWLTIREMLYFTMYHVEHHKKLILQGLGRL